MSRIQNTSDIKSKKLIYYSLIHPYLTYCINVWSSTYRTNFKTLCTAQKRSVRTLFAIAQLPHSRDNFINQKICLWTNWLINRKVRPHIILSRGKHFLLMKISLEWGSLQCNQCMAHICWTTFSIMEMLGIKSNLEMVVTRGYHYMQQLNLNSLFAIELSKRGMAYHVTCAAHHHSVLSRINYDNCIWLSHSFLIYVVSMIIKLLSRSTEVTMQCS